MSLVCVSWPLAQGLEAPGVVGMLVYFHKDQSARMGESLLIE
jgi:hypothetical protein